MVYELANLEVTRGDLDRASPPMESLQVDDATGDIQARPVPRSMMARCIRSFSAATSTAPSPSTRNRCSSWSKSATSKARPPRCIRWPRSFSPRRPRPRPRPLPGIVAVPGANRRHQGKAASLSMMAQVFLTRGDLDRAPRPLPGIVAGSMSKSATSRPAASLSMMAQVFLTAATSTRALIPLPGIVAGLRQIGDIKARPPRSR